ncbi:MAG: hypothetical protein D3920_14400, partial [Candidatus Electrothrix sp. AW2]|nr:hypothetical protein [Candidatus Electrothrix gigas]
EEAVTVQVQEPVPGDWEILEKSAPHVKENASTAVWQIKVEPKSIFVLSIFVTAGTGRTNRYGKKENAE